MTPNSSIERPQTVRAFVAVRVDDTVEAAIAATVDELRTGRDGIRRVRRDNLHLTLKFLGPEVPVAKLDPLRLRLEQIAAETEPFDIRVSGVGGFPNLDRPRVIWVGLVGEPLAELARRVEQASVECGFEREKRAFTGHLTIARVSSLRGFDATRRALLTMRERDFGVSHIGAMTLYRSTLTPQGSIYDRVAAFALGGSG